MNTETREKIERLRAHEEMESGEIIDALLGHRAESYKEHCERLRECAIDLLERSDPDGWTDEMLADAGLVRMPRDKDGEFIHVGDTVRDFDGAEWTVLELRLFNNADEGVFIRVGKFSGEKYETVVCLPQALTHRPPVTMESVLWELADGLASAGESWSADYHKLNLIKEAAKRLRLAEVAE